MDIARAINDRIVVEFTYDGFPRRVQPAAYGVSTTGKESLRGCLIGGNSRSNTIPCWEFYTVAKIENLVLTDGRFEEFALPGYVKGDSMLPTIFAQH